MDAHILLLMFDCLHKKFKRLSCCQLTLTQKLSSTQASAAKGRVPGWRGMLGQDDVAIYSL